MMILQVNNVELDMKVDIGACMSIISMAIYCLLWPKHLASPLQLTNKWLRTYRGEALKIQETNAVSLSYQVQQVLLELGRSPSLFGQEWLQELKLDWDVYIKCQPSTLQSVLDKHAWIFMDELRFFVGNPVRIYVDPAGPSCFWT